MARALRWRGRVRLGSWTDLFTGDLAKARELFHRTYGFAPNDKRRVDEEIVRLFREHADAAEDQVPIPAVLVQALMLRKGFARGRGGGYMRGEREKRDKINMAIWETHQLAPALKQKYPRRLKALRNNNCYDLGRCRGVIV